MNLFKFKFKLSLMITKFYKSGLTVSKLTVIMKIKCSASHNLFVHFSKIDEITIINYTSVLRKNVIKTTWS